MTNNKRFIAALFSTSLFMAYAPISLADTPQLNYSNNTFTPTTQINDGQQNLTYNEKISQKAKCALGNLTMGWLEIPKNIINTTNNSNIFYGIVGGGFKGFVNTGGRMGVAVADLLTFPLPTKPIAHPLYAWEDFDVDTTYGDVMQVNKTPPPAAPKKILSESAQQPVAAPVYRAPPVDRSQQYNPQTNKQLDKVFSEEMQK
ncbi:MAG: exosortase system-associated protein, TIGR04073 family [Methylococcales bacterium]|nr:exosortase system-associated protein, TIGR04073 family [Methylococcales bacterium]